MRLLRWAVAARSDGDECHWGCASIVAESPSAVNHSLRKIVSPRSEIVSLSRPTVAEFVRIPLDDPRTRNSHEFRYERSPPSGPSVGRGHRIPIPTDSDIDDQRHVE